MITNEAPRLIVRKILVNAILFVALAGLFVLLTSFIEGGDISFPTMIVAIILFVSLSFDVVLFAMRNPTNQLIVHYNDPQAEEKLDAILDVLGYSMHEQHGDTQVYRPSFMAGGLNGKVVMKYTPTKVVVTGPQFALHHMANRLWLFRYPGIGFHWADKEQEQRYAQMAHDYEEMSQMAPFGENTGYEPTGAAAFGGR